ncbi:FeoB-associated Cys-rich membrane protein [Tenacibaculum sp. HL-MS23]|nr:MULTISPECIES: FeoB-associated Cys-rich membrane protein [unclassified Tenacibaculum]WNW01075.1 FeoB-associated Cys-rich membrane protein [Tenacibaculum sp. HL-MS23]
MQEIITYIAVGLAVFFLVKKFFIKKNNKGCNTDCNCS